MSDKTGHDDTDDRDCRAVVVDVVVVNLMCRRLLRVKLRRSCLRQQSLLHRNLHHHINNNTCQSATIIESIKPTLTATTRLPYGRLLSFERDPSTSYSSTPAMSLSNTPRTQCTHPATLVAPRASSLIALSAGDPDTFLFPTLSDISARGGLLSGAEIA